MQSFTFDGLFKETLSVFKSQKRLIFLASLVYYVPVVLYGIYTAVRDLPDILAGEAAGSADVISAIPFILLSILLSFFMTITIIYAISQKKPLGIKEALDGGYPFYGKSILLHLLLYLALIPLFILLIVPGIIFSVYWAFSIYALIIDKETIVGSMQKSRRIVAGCWWKVFGYSMGVGAIIAAGIIFANFALMIPYLFSIFAYTLLGEGMRMPVLAALIFHILVYDMLVALLTIFYAVYMQRFYLRLRTKNKEG